MKTENKHIGSRFDDFLTEEGIKTDPKEIINLMLTKMEHKYKQCLREIEFECVEQMRITDGDSDEFGTLLEICKKIRKVL